MIKAVRANNGKTCQLCGWVLEEVSDHIVDNSATNEDNVVVNAKYCPNCKCYFYNDRGKEIKEFVFSFHGTEQGILPKDFELFEEDSRETKPSK